MPAYMTISHLVCEMPKPGLLPSTFPGVQPGKEVEPCERHGKGTNLGLFLCIWFGTKEANFSNPVPTNAFSCQLFVIDKKHTPLTS